MYRMRSIPVLVCCLSFVHGLTAVSEAPASVALANSGVARLPIIISPTASESTRAVATELSDYLKRITGADFSLETGDGARGILVGTLAEFPDASLDEALAIRDTFDGKEAFAIRTETNRIRLIGATDLGASHAVFRLLEHLGCRWYFPAPEWEHIPTQSTLSVSLNETDRPAIPSRRIWWNFAFFDYEQGQCEAAYRAWSRHNRMAQSQTIWCGHAWQSIISDNQATFDAHPEYLALVAGKRTGPQFCSTHPDVRAMATEWALSQLRRDPKLDMVSMETSDMDGHCECEACVKAGTVSDRAFGLANEVARAVAAEFPGKQVGLYAYNDHSEPPSFDLEPNVYVQLTAGFTRGRYTFEELLERWPAKTRNLGFYDYYSFWLWDWDMPPGGLGGNLKSLRERIPRYAKLGATSLDAESGNNWGLHGRGYYIANRLMWNPEVDVDALLADFYTTAFGPAAATMARYYERLDPGNEPLASEDTLARALRDLEEATALVADDPKVLARLDHLKQYQHYVRLRWDYDREVEVARKKELALAALSHVYRNRYSYMNHWEAIRQLWTEQLAKDLGEPTWVCTEATMPKPWMVETPSTREETAADFQSDLVRFQPDPVEEITFLKDLVPSGLAAVESAASTQHYQNPMPYALYSKTGEPLVLTIHSGLIAHYRDRADASYTITDSAGNEIVRARVKQDGEARELSIPVPGAGLYWLNYQDQAVGWGVTIPAGSSISIAPPRYAPPAQMGQMARIYFYVPKGTRQIQYFWEGGPHKVLDPEGQLVTTVNTRGSHVKIDVPEGADGKAWSFAEISLGHLWFFNVPNYLAASPDALLVPREVAARDGLLR